jgi:wyosine [tRNA(Phe)-imidazoG37] synthetase (radical SAM superfamily)
VRTPHLFGPVNSRRLGRSLGVNCLTGKTCDLDCVYCECGVTIDLTIDRQPYVPGAVLIAELDEYLAGKPPLDYVTFGGSGEPTLNSDLGAVVAHLKERFPQYKTALLTNATLFMHLEVRRACLPFDLVCPSLDAVSDEVFDKVNRHHRGLENRSVIEGLVAFSKEYAGAVWLEVFIVPGLNDTPRELALFRETIPRIRAERVQINSLDRPAACDWVRVPSRADLLKIAEQLSPVGIPVEIISRA